MLRVAYRKGITRAILRNRRNGKSGKGYTAVATSYSGLQFINKKSADVFDLCVFTPFTN